MADPEADQLAARHNHSDHLPKGVEFKTPVAETYRSIQARYLTLYFVLDEYDTASFDALPEEQREAKGERQFKFWQEALKLIGERQQQLSRRIRLSDEVEISRWEFLDQEGLDEHRGGFVAWPVEFAFWEELEAQDMMSLRKVCETAAREVAEQHAVTLRYLEAEVSLSYSVTERATLAL